MPQSSDELREKMVKRFGDKHGVGIVDDGPPADYLIANGWTHNRFLWTSPARPIEEDEWDCMDYLIEEWDHAYECGKQA